MIIILKIKYWYDGRIFQLVNQNKINIILIRNNKKTAHKIKLLQHMAAFLDIDSLFEKYMISHKNNFLDKFIRKYRKSLMFMNLL